MDEPVFVDTAPEAAQPLLQEILTYLETEVAPNANRIDQQKSLLSSALQALAELGIFRLAPPEAVGGLGCPPSILWHLALKLGEASGALAFLVSQHQTALSIILEHPNSSVAQAYFSDLMLGKTLIGVGFSHLRYNHVDLKAHSLSQGYLLKGNIPWLSGFQHMTMVVVAAELPDEQTLFALLPLMNAQQSSGGILHLTLPLPLAAVPSTQTVQAEVIDWFVPPEDVVGIGDPNWIEQRDSQKLLRGSAAPLGCARASLQVLATFPQSAELYACLWDRWQFLYTTIQQELGQLNPPYHAKLRAKAVQLAVRAAQAAMITTGGSAVLLNHTVQRLYREAMLYMVTGLNNNLRDALLAELLVEERCL